MGVCLCFALCILCSCDGAKDILLQTGSYSGTCSVIFGDSAYDMTVEVGEGGNMTAVFSSPAELAGLKFCFAGEEFTLSYQEMNWTGNSEDFPSASAVTAIRNAFVAVGRSGAAAQQTSDGLYMLQGSCDSGDYKFSFNADGSPHALTIESIELQTAFSSGVSE